MLSDSSFVEGKDRILRYYMHNAIVDQHVRRLDSGRVDECNSIDDRNVEMFASESR